MPRAICDVEHSGSAAARARRFARATLRDWHLDALTIEAEMVAEKAAQYAAQTERLEQRVQVLERIITDRGVAIADEIEKLRDAPLN